MALPATPPPPALLPRALPYLCARIAAATVDGPSALLPVLSLTLSALARARLSSTPTAVPLQPLHAFVSVATETDVPLTMVCDALLAYPAEVAELRPALDVVVKRRRGEVVALVEGLIQRLSQPSTSTSNSTSTSTSSTLSTLRLLHALHRTTPLVPAHTTLQALAASYPALAVREKAEALVLARALADTPETRTLLPSGKPGTPLVDQAIGDDFGLFSNGRVGERERDVLRGLHDDERGDDPRLTPLLALFPTLPAHLLADALSHPAFAGAGSRASASEAAAPLVDAIFAGTLPPELAELRAAVADAGTGGAGAGATSPVAAPSVPAPEKAARRTQWNDDELDLGRLRLKGQSEPAIGTEIPDTLRASILRLVEAQEEEEEEAARALKEHRGMFDDDEEDDVPAARVRLADGDESDAATEDDGVESDASDGPPPELVSRTAKNVTTHLELAYLRTPAVFNRDAATRRSAARRDLKAQTGMDDGQIEGWKIMLEKNPHKDAILERHQWTRDRPKESGSSTPASEASSRGRGGRGGGGRGGGGRSGGGGGGSGGASGSGGGGASGGGRGGGSGRGRGNKGSRGHSNAARTRGHDKKMARMGAGA